MEQVKLRDTESTLLSSWQLFRQYQKLLHEKFLKQGYKKQEEKWKETVKIFIWEDVQKWKKKEKSQQNFFLFHKKHIKTQRSQRASNDRKENFWCHCLFPTIFRVILLLSFLYLFPFFFFCL